MQVISGKVQKAKKAVLYGPEGIGKSSLAAKFPRPIFIDTEGSTTEMDVNRLPKPSSWEMLKQQVGWVKQQGPSRFGTLVIDTIDWAEMLCNESVCAQHGKTGIEDFGHGKGYVYSGEEFGRFLNLLSDVIEAGINVVLTAHAKIAKFEQPDEMGAYDRYQLKLGAKTGSRTAPMVKEWADMVLFINYKTFSVATDEKGKKHKGQGGIRTIYATHHPAWDAKNRQGLPDEFPLDYGQIAHIFSGTAGSVSQPDNSTQEPTTIPAEKVDAWSQPDPAKQPHQPGMNATATYYAEASADKQARQEATPQQATGLDPNIPRSLLDLMSQHQVSEGEIKLVVSQKGYYTIDTPITNYDPSFIEGVLVGAWPKVFEMVQATRGQIPFSV